MTWSIGGRGYWKTSCDPLSTDIGSLAFCNEILEPYERVFPRRKDVSKLLIESNVSKDFPFYCSSFRANCDTIFFYPILFFHVSIFCVFHIRMTMIDLLGISIHYMLQLVPVSRGWVRRYLFMVLRNIQQ